MRNLIQSTVAPLDGAEEPIWRVVLFDSYSDSVRAFRCGQLVLGGAGG
jgi:hypothetical protein